MGRRNEKYLNEEKRSERNERHGKKEREIGQSKEMWKRRKKK